MQLRTLVEDYQMVEKTNTVSMSTHSVSGPVPSITHTFEHLSPYILCDIQEDKEHARKILYTLTANKEYNILKGRNYVLLVLCDTHITSPSTLLCI